MTKFCIETVPAPTEKAWNPPPLIVTGKAIAFEMVTSWVIAVKELAKLIVPPAIAEQSIVSPAFDAAIALRSVPAPASAVLVTLIVAAAR